MKNFENIFYNLKIDYFEAFAYEGKLADDLLIDDYTVPYSNDDVFIILYVVKECYLVYNINKNYKIHLNQRFVENHFKEIL